MPKQHYTLLQSLLPWLELYEQEHASDSVVDFHTWLGQQLAQEQQATPPEAPPATLDGEIARYLTVLNKYAKFYIRKALHPTEFVSFDDFGYLMHLLDGGSMTKSELIVNNIHTIPSGTEIIKRLIRQGWVVETRDETDKRRVNLTINEQGKAALFASLGQLRKVSKIVSANLSTQEKQQLLQILKKMDTFHHSAFLENKDKSSEELLD